MKKIALERGEGKTHFLVQQSLLYNVPIVVANKNEKQRLLSEYKGIPIPIPVQDILDGSMRGSRRMDCGIYVDNMEAVLQSALGDNKILISTISNENMLQGDDLFLFKSLKDNIVDVKSTNTIDAKNLGNIYIDDIQSMDKLDLDDIIVVKWFDGRTSRHIIKSGDEFGIKGYCAVSESGDIPVEFFSTLYELRDKLTNTIKKSFGLNIISSLVVIKINEIIGGNYE